MLVRIANREYPDQTAPALEIFCLLSAIFKESNLFSQKIEILKIMCLVL